MGGATAWAVLADLVFRRSPVRGACFARSAAASAAGRAGLPAHARRAARAAGACAAPEDGRRPPPAFSSAAGLRRLDVAGVNHVSLETRNVARLSDFYAQVVGLRAIPRPDFGFGGAWFQLPQQVLPDGTPVALAPRDGRARRAHTHPRRHDVADD
jgi:hypothetical protein